MIAPTTAVKPPALGASAAGGGTDQKEVVSLLKQLVEQMKQLNQQSPFPPAGSSNPGNASTPAPGGPSSSWKTLYDPNVQRDRAQASPSIKVTVRKAAPAAAAPSTGQGG
jgi:hypothetical protein